MLILIITITTLFFIRKYFPNQKKYFNTTLIILTLWLVLGLTLRYFFSDPPQRKYLDIEMAQTYIKDNPKLCKGAKTKILDDGTIKIILKGGKPLYLKHGVITSKK